MLATTIVTTELFGYLNAHTPKKVEIENNFMGVNRELLLKVTKQTQIFLRKNYRFAWNSTNLKNVLTVSNRQ